MEMCQCVFLMHFGESTLQPVLVKSQQIFNFLEPCVFPVERHRDQVLALLPLIGSLAGTRNISQNFNTVKNI